MFVVPVSVSIPYYKGGINLFLAFYTVGVRSTGVICIGREEGQQTERLIDKMKGGPGGLRSHGDNNSTSLALQKKLAVDVFCFRLALLAPSSVVHTRARLIFLHGEDKAR